MTNLLLVKATSSLARSPVKVPRHRSLRCRSITISTRRGASPCTHPLLVQLEKLLRDLRGVESQPQTLDVNLGDDVLQHLLQRQAAGRPVSRSGWNGVLQDGSTECRQLAEKTMMSFQPDKQSVL